MIRLTVEETNLLSIYNEGIRISSAIPAATIFLAI